MLQLSWPPEVLPTVPEAERAVPDNRLELGKLPLVRGRVSGGMRGQTP